MPCSGTLYGRRIANTNYEKCEVIFMDGRIKDFMGKVNYVNWLWTCEIGVPMRVTFGRERTETSEATANDFCQTCMSFFDRNRMYDISRLKVNSAGTECTICFVLDSQTIPKIPSSRCLSLTGSKYDKMFKTLVDLLNETHSYLKETRDETDASIHVGSVTCDFTAIESAVNSILVQEIFDNLRKNGEDIIKAFCVSLDSADYTFNRTPVQYYRNWDYHILRPEVQITFSPNSEYTPAKGSVTVHIEHPLFKDPDTTEILRLAIHDALRTCMSYFKLEIENTFIYLAECEIS